MKINVIDFSGTIKKTLSKVLEKMNSVQQQYEFIYQAPRNIKVPPKDEFLKWENGYEVVREWKTLSKLNDKAIGVFACNLAGNWFSTTSFEHSVSLISINGWDLLSHLPIEAYLTLEIAENTLEQLVKHENYDFTHEPPIGCISDMCMYKTDINLKILTAYVCPKCKEDIIFNIGQESYLEFMQLFNLAREYALGKVPSDPVVEENKLMFPIAITLRKLKNESDIRNKFTTLLDLFDLSVRITAILLASRLKIIDPTVKLIMETKNPALGDWVTSINEGLRKLKAMGDVYFERDYAKIESAYSLIEKYQLVNLRNDTKGHAYTMPPYIVQQYFQNANPQVHEVIRHLATLLSHELIITQVTTYVLESNSYATKALKLMGDNSMFSENIYNMNIMPEQLPMLLTPNIALVLNSKKTDYIKVDPYIIYKECPSCRHPQLMVVDYEEKYLDVQIGHRVNLGEIVC